MRFTEEERLLLKKELISNRLCC